MPRIRTRDGHALQVRVLGRGSPCMLVHGFGTDSRSWLPFIAPLMHRHRFILPDLRGFGLNHQVPIERECPLTTYAQDLEDVLDALSVRELPVIAISMGAFTTVQSFRLFGGGRFSRYMHIDQGPVIRNRAEYEFGLLGSEQAQFFERVRALLDALEGELMQKRYEELPDVYKTEFWRLLGEFAAAAFSLPTLKALMRTLAEREALIRQFFAVERWQSYIQVVRAYLDLDYDLREGFRAIRVPLTVLIGGASQMYPPAGQRTILELAPHADIREIPNVGHMLPYEAPRRFMRELREFLAPA